MEVKTFTKRDIAIKVGKNLNMSIRKSIIFTDEVFKAVRELLCEDDDYIRVEIRNFGVLESKPAKAKPKARVKITKFQKAEARTKIFAQMHSLKKELKKAKEYRLLYII